MEIWTNDRPLCVRFLSDGFANFHSGDRASFYSFSLFWLSFSISLCTCLLLNYRKTALQNHKLWYERFFSVESNGEGPRSKFEREDGQTDGQKWPKNLGWRRRAADMSHWCQASAVRGCVPILIIPEFDAALDRDSLNELTWVSFVVHWHLTIFFFFFFFVFSWVSVWQDSDRVQSVTQGTWYSGRSSMLSSDSWLIDIGERSHPNPMHRSSLFQRDFQNR